MGLDTARQVWQAVGVGRTAASALTSALLTKGDTMSSTVTLAQLFGHELTVVATRPRRPKREWRDDPRCQRCKQVRPAEHEWVSVVPFKRSIIAGTRSCLECDGEGIIDMEPCLRCTGHGYVFKYETRWFDRVCPACALELRRGTR